MEEFLQFAQTYRWALGTAGAVLAGLILLFYLARILRQIKRLNKSLGSIAENIQAYVDVVMSEEEEAEEAAEKNSAEREQARGQRQEAEPYQQIAQDLKRMEDEQLFNSVLQEYFS